MRRDVDGDRPRPYIPHPPMSAKRHYTNGQYTNGQYTNGQYTNGKYTNGPVEPARYKRRRLNGPMAPPRPAHTPGSSALRIGGSSRGTGSHKTPPLWGPSYRPSVDPVPTPFIDFRSGLYRPASAGNLANAFVNTVPDLGRAQFDLHLHLMPFSGVHLRDLLVELLHRVLLQHGSCVDQACCPHSNPHHLHHTVVAFIQLKWRLGALSLARPSSHQSPSSHNDSRLPSASSNRGSSSFSNDNRHISASSNRGSSSYNNNRLLSSSSNRGPTSSYSSNDGSLLSVDSCPRSSASCPSSSPQIGRPCPRAADHSAHQNADRACESSLTLAPQQPSPPASRRNSIKDSHINGQPPRADPRSQTPSSRDVDSRDWTQLGPKDAEAMTRGQMRVVGKDKDATSWAAVRDGQTMTDTVATENTSVMTDATTVSNKRVMTMAVSVENKMVMTDTTIVGHQESMTDGVITKNKRIMTSRLATENKRIMTSRLATENKRIMTSRVTTENKRIMTDSVITEDKCTMAKVLVKNSQTRDTLTKDDPTKTHFVPKDGRAVEDLLECPQPAFDQKCDLADTETFGHVPSPALSAKSLPGGTVLGQHLHGWGPPSAGGRQSWVGEKEPSALPGDSSERKRQDTQHNSSKGSPGRRTLRVRLVRVDHSSSREKNSPKDVTPFTLSKRSTDTVSSDSKLSSAVADDRRDLQNESVSDLTDPSKSVRNGSNKNSSPLLGVSEENALLSAMKRSRKTPNSSASSTKDILSLIGDDLLNPSSHFHRVENRKKTLGKMPSLPSKAPRTASDSGSATEVPKNVLNRLRESLKLKPGLMRDISADAKQSKAGRRARKESKEGEKRLGDKQSKSTSDTTDAERDTTNTNEDTHRGDSPGAVSTTTSAPLSTTTSAPLSTTTSAPLSTTTPPPLSTTTPAPLGDESSLAKTIAVPAVETNGRHFVTFSTATKDRQVARIRIHPAPGEVSNVADGGILSPLSGQADGDRVKITIRIKGR